MIVFSYPYDANLPANQMNLSGYIGQVSVDGNLPTQEVMVQDGNLPSTHWGHFSTPFEISHLNFHGYSSDSDGENLTGGGILSENFHMDYIGYSSDSDGENQTGGGIVRMDYLGYSSDSDGENQTGGGIVSDNFRMDYLGYSSDSDGENQTGGGIVSDNFHTDSLGYSSDGENQTGGGTVSDNFHMDSLGNSSDGENQTGGGNTATTGQPIHFHFITAVLFTIFFLQPIMIFRSLQSHRVSLPTPTSLKFITRTSPSPPSPSF